MIQFTVSLQKPDSTFDNVGMNNRFITDKYKSLRTLLRYGISLPAYKRGFKVYDRQGRLVFTSGNIVTEVIEAGGHLIKRFGSGEDSCYKLTIHNRTITFYRRKEAIGWAQQNKIFHTKEK